MDSEKYKALLAKYLNGECTDEEQALLDSWYEEIGKNVEKKGLDTEGVENEEILLKKNWVALKSKIVEEPIALKPIRTRRYWLAAAAVVLLLSVGGYWFLNKKDNPQAEIVASDNKITPIKTIEKHNKSTETMRLELSDKSIVLLKPNSILRYAEIFEDDKREVTLEGEAFFDVTKNPQKPFFVYTNDVVTKVLGTSFTIRSNKDTKNVTVDVRTGKVSVYSEKMVHGQSKSDPETIGVVLTPNQSVRYLSTENRLLKSLVEEPILLIPKEALKKFTFSEAPIAKIFAALETAYGIEIIYDEEVMKDCTMTTTLEDENLHEKLAIICKLLKASYKMVDAQVVISSKGCL
jgi:ferric-dicitrate binding protein FerR (iron transport regulator)